MGIDKVTRNLASASTSNSCQGNDPELNALVQKIQSLDPNSDDANVKAMRSFIDKLGSTPGVLATALQTVGGKGYDGFIIALVTASPQQL